MTRKEATEFIRNNPEQYLIRANKKGYVCPICRNGEGKDGTGLEHKPSDKTHFTCFKCNQIINNDVIDIIAIEHGLQVGSKEAFEKAYELYNIEITDTQPTTNRHTTDNKPTVNRPNNAQNINDYINKCHKETTEEALKYLKNRGLEGSTVLLFKIGYDTEKKRIIIPYENRHRETNYYISRSMNDNTTPKYMKPRGTQTGAKEPIFNSADLEQITEPIFIVESPFCALSIIQEGFKCVAIGGTGGQKLTDYIKDNKLDHKLILVLDKDKAGQEAQDKLYKELLKLNISVVQSDNFYLSEVKDPNEYAVKDKDSFIKWLNNEALKIKNYKEYYQDKESLNSYLETFEKEFETEGEQPKQTGFKTLDNFLDGGLFAGLYCIGGISSLGKTTFTLQIADQIAESGQDVFIFSLEMSKKEILSKSLSRLTAEIDQKSKKATGKTTRDILKGGKDWQDKDKATLKRALNKYKSIAKNIYIYEGVGNIGVKQVTEKIYKHYEVTGNTPIIIIDYLQILAPYDPKMTDKQNTDKNVIELKRLSRDLKTPIIVISSFNRENYNNVVSMSSFKESGAIEYSSDVLIGLQFNFMRQAEKDEEDKDRSDRDKKNYIDEEREKAFNKAKNKEAQEINLRILKNRNGNKGDLIFKYYPMFNIFTEDIKEDLKDSNGVAFATEVQTRFTF